VSIALTSHTMNDGSRKFAALPESCSWSALRKHLGTLAGVGLGEYVTDGVTEAWIDFTYRGYSFTINNQFGEFGFSLQTPRVRTRFSPRSQVIVRSTF